MLQQQAVLCVNYRTVQLNQLLSMNCDKYLLYEFSSSQILNTTANTLATPVLNQMTSWRHIITFRLTNYLLRNGHFVIKKTI